MPKVTCVVGGQYGSEGKGVICGYISDEYDIAVRVGSPNAGHTLKIGKNKWKLQQIPVAGLVNPDCVLLIGAASLINLEILKREMEYIKDIDGRFFIDRNAGIIEHRHKTQEEDERMFDAIGSTCEGVGAALRHKIKRDKTFRIAGDIRELDPYVINVADYINNLPADKRVMIEGTQGYALSLNHGPYPFCTSRDVLASSLLSDVGLAPSLCNEVVMVIRTYPIRVAGNSGPMCGRELTWEEVTKRAGYPSLLSEKTTVTKRIRRVCEFDMKLVREACEANRPDWIALTFADYLDYANLGKTFYTDLTEQTQQFVEWIEEETGVPVKLIKTSIEFEGIIDRRLNTPERKILSKGDKLYDEGKHI